MLWQVFHVSATLQPLICARRTEHLAKSWTGKAYLVGFTKLTCPIVSHRQLVYQEKQFLPKGIQYGTFMGFKQGCTDYSHSWSNFKSGVATSWYWSDPYAKIEKFGQLDSQRNLPIWGLSRLQRSCTTLIVCKKRIKQLDTLYVRISSLPHFEYWWNCFNVI